METDLLIHMILRPSLFLQKLPKSASIQLEKRTISRYIVNRCVDETAREMADAVDLYGLALKSAYGGASLH